MLVEGEPIETDSKSIQIKPKQKKSKYSWAPWCLPAVPTTLEVEIGGLHFKVILSKKLARPYIKQ
jgi:hypothetical protein